MISRESFSRNWIEKQRARFPKADPQLIERQIYAFELVGLLAKSNRPFVFKGGTSLVLILPEPHRLSIDVDIVGDLSLDDLTQLSSGTVFSRVEEDTRSMSKVPKRHFKFYYRSSLDGKETYILLDILYSPHGYPRLNPVPIRSSLFDVDEEQRVQVPTIDGILGDKLTAFAPRTTGVPFGRRKSMEIIKQLFDIGELFNSASSLLDTAESYRAIHGQESKYHEPMPDIAATLDDTIETAFLLCQSRLKGSLKDPRTDELDAGIKQIQSYLLGRPFRIEEARRSAAKAALVATIIRSGRRDLDLDKYRYSDAKLRDLQNATIEGERSILNRLKATQAETFYYWWLISRFV